MNRHKHLKRLEQLRDVVLDYYNGDAMTMDPEDKGLWLIWCALLKDIEKCGSSAVFKIDGIRLYYYNALWKKVNNKDHESFPKEGPKYMKLHDPRAPRWASTLMDEFYVNIKEDPLDRAEWLAKQPLPSYMWTEAKKQ